MRLRVSPNDGLPIYLQVMEQIRYLVASGGLRPGDELPPIRALAEQLLINPNTVARAYRELEREGVLVSRRGAGTYVADRTSPLAQGVRERALEEKVDGVLVLARQLGFGVNDVLAAVRARAEHLELNEGEISS